MDEQHKEKICRMRRHNTKRAIRSEEHDGATFKREMNSNRCTRWTNSSIITGESREHGERQNLDI